MKTFFLLLSILCLAVTQLNAQAPEGINYQAVIRNASGTLVASTTVAIRIQLRQGSATGSIVYQERHSTMTTAQGLVNLVIGNGTVQSGSFGAINWGSGPYFVNLAVDFSNGTNYQDFGTQQLMSVPFALYAKTAGNQLNQWRYGNGAPATTLGAFGDFYLDVQNGNVYYKNTGSSWVLTGNITGPQGAIGATGPAGPQGPQGIQGATGAAGATGPQGPAGVAGPQGPAGTNGNTILNGTTNPTAGIGVNGDYYMNTATNTFFGPKANGTWPAGFLMIGPQGAQGIQGATGPQGPIGLTGPAGPTGAQGPQGIQGVAGTNGTNGQNTLVKTTTEPAGANCTTGGVKIEYGLDANNNGTLDIAEINASLTKYVCNGAVGATGATGSTGPQGPIGLTGPAGPIGAQGPQGIQGVAGTNGLNALIKTTTEPTGSNCTNGGTKIETGLDANSNGTLDASEVNASQTQYVCNGGASQVNFSSGVNAQHGYKVFTADTFFIVNQNKLFEVILRSGNGGNGGSNSCAIGGIGGMGSGAKFFLSVDQGDTISIKVGSNGVNGCYGCVPSCGIPSGGNGTNGTSSILSINSINHTNFIVKANPGSGGSGGGPYFSGGNCGCWSAGANGVNGSLEYGTNYNSSGVLNLTETNGQGAFVSFRW